MKALLVIILTIAPTFPAFSQDVIDVTIDITRGRISKDGRVIQRQPDVRLTTTQSKATARADILHSVRKQLNVAVVSNALLYDVEAKLTEEPIAEVVNFTALAETLAGVMKALDLPSGAVSKVPVTQIQGIAFKSLQENYVSLQNAVDSIKDIITQSVDDPAGARAKANTLKIADVDRFFTDAFRKFRDANEKCILGEQITFNANLKLACTEAEGVGPYVVIHSLLLREAETREALSLLKDFVADLGAVGREQALESLDFSSSKNRTITLTVTKRKKYAKYIDAQVKEYAEKSFVVEDHPQQLLSFGAPSPAVVYSFVRAPKFEAVRQGEQFIIKETTPEYQEFTIAAMTTITPSLWEPYAFLPALQIGVSPEKNKVGFFAGLALRAPKYFSIGGGVAWQQVQQLADGLSKGQIINAAADLHTTNRFRHGAYLHISVDYGKK